MSRQLEVWLSGSHIGTLAQVDGRLALHYAADWLTHSAAMPLSQSLPLRAEPFDDRATRPFFAGLLPRIGSNRPLLAQQVLKAASSMKVFAWHWPVPWGWMPPQHTCSAWATALTCL